MKNNLIIFGDSFSTNFSVSNEINLEESWPALLSNKLDYNLYNFANAGISNCGILNNIYTHLKFNELTKSDVIIIGFTFYDRMYDFWKNVGIDLKNNDTTSFSELEVKFYQYKQIDDDAMNKYTHNTLLQYNFIINSLKKITPNVFFWNMDKCEISLFDEMVKNNTKNYIKPFDKICWMDYCNETPEWWQKNDDRHFGKTGHLEFFQYLYEYIQKDLI
jgi:hypothetical protein